MKLLFIPGSGSGKTVWLYQTGYFKDSEAVALPGHPEGRLCSSVDDYVDWLRDYIHQHQYQDVVLAGHSLGGAIAQTYGLRYPKEVKALVLIGTGARLRVRPAFLATMEEMTADKGAWQKYLEDTHRLVNPGVRQPMVEERMRIGPAVMLNDLLCCDKFDILDKVHTIKLPTLLICGNQDEMTPAKFTHYLVSKIEGATEVVIEGADHWVHVQKAGEVNQAIDEFLRSLGG